MSTSNTGGALSWRRWLVVLGVWAAIYLPGLGTLEIKGEEGRRILPAITMLQTGNYVVPYVGSDAYFTKPPLVNWLVASSFKLFGVRNEWTARFPSALCVLVVALAFAVVARRSLGGDGSLAAALVWMTNFGIIEKGRLIELEALYVSLTGLAFICWLSWWQERRSPWVTWTVPWIFLGLGLLAKGPLHLLFFYAVVVAILYRAGALRSLLHAAHLAGVLLMLAIFAAWAIPCLQMMQGEEVAHTWSRQFSGRLSGEDFKLSGWLMNIPRGLGYFLPWVLLFPLARCRQAADRNIEHPTSNIEHRTKEEGAGAEFPASTFDVRCSASDVSSGLAWGIGISFLCVSLLPGSLPRYTMPLLVPAAWLMALVLTSLHWQLPRWFSWRKPAAWPAELRLPAVVAIIVCMAIALYVLVVMPFRQQREKVRPIAREINAALPAAAPLFAIDPEYQLALFYVRDPIVYLDRIADIPVDARYLLVQPKHEQEARASAQWAPRTARTILRLTDYRRKELILLEIGAAN